MNRLVLRTTLRRDSTPVPSLVSRVPQFQINTHRSETLTRTHTRMGERAEGFCRRVQNHEGKITSRKNVTVCVWCVATNPGPSRRMLKFDTLTICPVSWNQKVNGAKFDSGNFVLRIFSRVC